jgi:hypothetical protein
LMVVENRVLMNVVFPSPDSPATCQSKPSLMCRLRTDHYSKSGTALCDNLVSVEWLDDGAKTREGRTVGSEAVWFWSAEFQRHFRPDLRWQCQWEKRIQPCW